MLTIAILAAVGRQFYRDLQQWTCGSATDGWVVLSGGCLYLAGWRSRPCYWQRLLAGSGQQPTAAATVRAYYIGHLGKYLPGKAWALFLRAGLVRGPGSASAWRCLPPSTRC